MSFHPWINKAIESAQKKVEARNFDIRKTLIKFDDVMNDQRQVIFSQRYKILKEETLEETLKSFFEEQMKNTLLAKSDYSKSKDEKAYLASMKSLTGNAFLDKELVEFANLNDPDFSTKLNEKYKSNKNDRINTIGQEQNDDLEKKIFLQNLNFNWRSHLQYLEQLRQVIGLRSYGQKDPLSEFKKEAFSLFEILLDKVKKDIIKFLFNLKIFIKKNKNIKEKEKVNKTGAKIGRNDKCPCGSGKKFKHCCGSI